MRLPVAVPEILCSHSLTEFRPLSLLIARCIRHWRRSQTSPLAGASTRGTAFDDASERGVADAAPYENSVIEGAFERLRRRRLAEWYGGRWS